LQGGAAVFRGGGGQPTVGENFSEVLWLGEEEREVRRRSNQSENHGGGAATRFTQRPTSSGAGARQKALRGEGEVGYAPRH
jgi:hypothetical protein